MVNYKKGDYVVITGLRHGLPNRGNFYKNTIRKIRRPDDVRNGIQTYEVYDSIFVLYEDEIRPVAHKYNRNDFVRVVDVSKVGDVVKIKDLNGVLDDVVTYSTYNSIYVLREDEIEPVDDKTVTVTFDVPLFNKKEAHRIAHRMVEKAFNDIEAEAAAAKPAPKKHEDWTRDEIELARRLIVNWVTDIVMDGGDVFWLPDEASAQPDTIKCFYYPECNTINNKTGIAVRMPDDNFNLWIGKCVSLAKALGYPVPEFIRHKNLEVD